MDAKISFEKLLVSILLIGRVVLVMRVERDLTEMLRLERRRRWSEMGVKVETEDETIVEFERVMRRSRVCPDS